MENNNRDDLGFMGEEFQRRFVKHLIENRDYFEEVYTILDQNKFTTDILRRIVGTMKERYAETNTPMNYYELEIKLSSDIHDESTKAIVLETIEALKNTSAEGMGVTMEEGVRFFKQQNLIKAVNTVNAIIKRGNPKEYDQIEGIFSDALMVNMGREMGFRLFDTVDSDLSPDYRKPITTGCEELDNALSGGLGEGELGVIIAPTNVGKAQPLYSKVLTPMGFVRMGDIKVGDLVIGGDGEPHKVTGVYPQGLRPICRLCFSNGAVCECDMEHLWSVRKNGEDCVMSLSEIMGEIIRCFKNSNAWEHRIKFPLLHNLRLPLLKNNKDLWDSFNNYVDIIKTGHQISDNGEIYYSQTDVDLYLMGLDFAGEKETQCIMVDSDEHTYITDDFIITHNTSICTGFAAAAALKKNEYNNYQGYKVLHFFFEDTPVTVRRKYYGYFTGIDAQDLHLPGYREKAIELLNSDSDSRRMLRDNVICHRLRSGEETAGSIVAIIKRYIALGFKPNLFILDYFECVEPEPVQAGEEKNEWKREGKTMRKFESICQDYHMAGWIPVQGTKDSYGAQYVGLRQAGGSATKTQIGHVIISLARPEEFKTTGQINLFVDKLRGIRFSRDKFEGVHFNNGTCRLDMSESRQVAVPIEEIPDILTEQGPPPF